MSVKRYFIISLCLMLLFLGYTAAVSYMPLIMPGRYVTLIPAPEEEIMRGGDSPYDPPAELPDGFVIDINSADAADFEMLPGIGPSLAGEIVAYRERNGAFRSTDGLMDVPGIGEARFSAVERYISVG